jgi:trans-aconitate 2-methyltransferase
MRETAAQPRWRQWFPDGRAKEWRSHPLEFYYNVLAPGASWVDLWATDYLHIMPDVDGIVNWYKSTGLRPYLDRIEDEAKREEFLDGYRSRPHPFYPKSQVGGVPFPFRRIVTVAGV